MKKTLFPILALVLALGLALPVATPVAGQDGPEYIETLYLSDSAVKGDGKTYLYTVELVEPDRAELTPLPQATNLDPPLGPGEIPFEQVDALACTPDGKKLYAIDKPTTNLGYYDLENSTWNIVESSSGEPAPTGIPECVLAAFSFDDPPVLYAASDSTDSLYTVNIATAASTLVGEIWDDKGTIDTSDDKKVNVSGADLVWGLGPTLYLWANNPGPGPDPGPAPRGLYTLTVPDPSTWPERVLASHLGSGSVGSYFTGLAIRGGGAGDLVGSTHEDEVMQIGKTNGDTLKTYMMYLGSSTEVYDYEYGDMTIGELAVEQSSASISDFVWEDTDADGIQDPGETGIDGVTVDLYDSGDNLVDTTTTDENGYYSFTGLAPGDYYLKFIAPEGYVFSPKDQGEDDTVDSDADPATGQTDVITLESDEDDDTWDAGLCREEDDGDQEQGCSPGYWKNHQKAWELTGYEPSEEVGDVFDNVPSNLGDDTLLEALKYGGGRGVRGAAKILLRAAVAALLNADHPDVNYPRSVDEVIDDVNSALTSNNRATMLSLASELDKDNNLGCPLH